MNQREKYIKRLRRAIDDTNEKISWIVEDRDQLVEDIEAVGGCAAFPLYNSAEEFWEAFKGFDPNAVDIDEDAWKSFQKQILWGCFSKYNLQNLPFVVTRYITYLEDELRELIVEEKVLEEHVQELNRQLYELEKPPQSISSPAKPIAARGSLCVGIVTHTASIPEEQTNDDGLKFPSSVTDYFYPDEVLRRKEIETLGFPKTEIIRELKYWICKIEATIGKEKKVAASRKIFRYLAEPYPKKFIEYHHKFKTTLEDKLKQFRYEDGLREAGTWWRNIFGTRMPV